MECAGYDSPCKKDGTTLVSLDSETEEMKLLFEACFKYNPNREIDRQTIQGIVIDENIMPSLDFNNRADQVKFGQKIDKFSNRILSNILMQPNSLETRAARRKFTFKSSVNENEPKSSQQCDNMVIFGNVPLLVPNSLKAITTDKVTLPYITRDYHLPQTEIKPTNFSLEELSAKGKAFLKKEIEETAKKPRVKTDRELQFWEAPECVDIKEQCTQEQVFQWIKNNPGVDYKTIHKNLGIGSFKHTEVLMNEGKIKKLNDGWEVNNV